LALGSIALGSCGLIDPSVDDFNLGFPKKTFAVDTASWNLTITDATFPSVPCGGDGECAAAAGTFCSGGCTATCVESTCQAHVTMSLYEDFNLAVDAPEYQTIDDQTAIDVTLDEIHFVIDTNTMNIPSPTLRVYMAPILVIDPTDPQAQLIGVVEPIPPGTTGPRPLVIDAPGREALEGFMSDFRTPFTVIVAAQADISAGDPVPQGMMQGWVDVRAHADAI
jgi:hypothetical protein